MTEQNIEKYSERQEIETEGKFPKFVSWIVFTWAMAVILMVFGWVLLAQASINTKLSEYELRSSEIKAQLAQIQESLVWIKEALKSNK